jgi:hypothetical protein
VTEDSTRSANSKKHGTVIAQQGQPLQFIEEPGERTSIDVANPAGDAVADCLGAYIRAARALLTGKYAGQKQSAPPHMWEPCNISILRCSDGIFVRYDIAQEGEGKIRWAESEMGLAELSPQFSDQMVHFPEDPSTYIPAGGRPEYVLAVFDTESRVSEQRPMGRPVIYAAAKLPGDFKIPPPPARPPCLVSAQNEIDFQLAGVVVPSDKPLKPATADAEHFIAHSRVKLPVGWQAIEIYPLLGDEYWKPEYAPLWAEIDLQAAILQNNLTASHLNGLDSRGTLRKHYAALIEEFEALLVGPEEPAHQFLKKHPELLCPTHDRFWSKLPFGHGPGKRISDFVFREPDKDYLLVEIEAPSREMFRKDGQQREELTHAINQIMDWVQYIADNKPRVESELGLEGISTNPRILVVIGRSASLTDDNRRKLVTLQAQQNKLRILTYDDLIATTRANLERILGPLSIRAENAEIYYYRVASQPPK